MALDLLALKTELQTDPQALGYAAAVASEQTWKLAEILNEPRAGISIFRGTLKTWEILAATDEAEYAALTAAKKDIYAKVLSVGELDVNDTSIRTILTALFGAGTNTRANLIARVSRQGSRAEQLFGQSVSSEDCSKALRS